MRVYSSGRILQLLCTAVYGSSWNSPWSRPRSGGLPAGAILPWGGQYCIVYIYSTVIFSAVQQALHCVYCTMSWGQYCTVKFSAVQYWHCTIYHVLGPRMKTSPDILLLSPITPAMGWNTHYYVLCLMSIHTWPTYEQAKICICEKWVSRVFVVMPTQCLCSLCLCWHYVRVFVDYTLLLLTICGRGVGVL